MSLHVTWNCLWNNTTRFHPIFSTENIFETLTRCPFNGKIELLNMNNCRLFFLFLYFLYLSLFLSRSLTHSIYLSLSLAHSITLCARRWHCNNFNSCNWSVLEAYTPTHKERTLFVYLAHATRTISTNQFGIFHSHCDTAWTVYKLYENMLLLWRLITLWNFHTARFLKSV